MKPRRSRTNKESPLEPTEIAVTSAPIAEVATPAESKAKSEREAAGPLSVIDGFPTDSRTAETTASGMAPVANTTQSPLQVRLSKSALEKLAFHTGSGQWTIDSILEQLIHDGLHKAFPAICYRGVEIAEAGLFRAFDRKTRRPAVVLKSTLGEFRINPRAENAEYRRWLEIYQKRGLNDFQEKAAEMCLFLLKQDLQEIRPEGAKHIIYPEDFLVERFI